jgi:hypothetical protein
MPVDVALQLLREGAGKHFEKKIVDAFLNYFGKNGLDSREDNAESLVYFDCDAKRLQRGFPVAFQMNRKVFSGIGVDISANGIYVAVDQEVREGSEIELSFALPDNNSIICNARGRVAWVNDRKERRKSSLPVGFGVEFIETDTPMETMQSFLNSYAEGNWHGDLKKPANDVTTLRAK